jgi:hypothetical protein
MQILGTAKRVCENQDSLRNSQPGLDCSPGESPAFLSLDLLSLARFRLMNGGLGWGLTCFVYGIRDVAVRLLVDCEYLLGDATCWITVGIAVAFVHSALKDGRFPPVYKICARFQSDI